MPTYFISDLHLSDKQPHLLKLFEHFIKNILQKDDVLYILGDLFEYWIGEDKTSHTVLQIKQLLKSLLKRNIRWFFLAGNRDFLLSKKFLQETNGLPLAEQETIELDKQRILLLHGDTLCTLDLAYQAFRKKVNKKWVQWLFLSLPLVIRKKLTGQIRHKSQQQAKQLTETITDVTLEAVSQAFKKFNASILIHGHVHKPGVHAHWDTQHKRWLLRYVLADWDTKGNYLCYANNEFTLSYFD